MNKFNETIPRVVILWRRKLRITIIYNDISNYLYVSIKYLQVMTSAKLVKTQLITDDEDTIML